MIFRNNIVSGFFIGIIKFLKHFFMQEHKISIRVRYAETDQMGVVYHGNYAQYFEMGRVEWLRNKGISYKELEKSGVMLPVVSLSMNYKKPAFSMMF